FEFSAVGSAVVAGIRPVIPLDLELLSPLLRRPGVIGNDCDATQWLETRRHRGRRDLDDTLDTGDRQRILWVVGFHFAAIDRAAAVSSICRAVAPATRIGPKNCQVLRDPSVFWSPYFGSPCPWMTLTRLQSASSSSASTNGKSVLMPVPISERLATMVTRPMSSIETKTLGAKFGVSAASAMGSLRNP